MQKINRNSISKGENKLTNFQPSLQAWTPNLAGDGPFLVIYNSKIYKNKKPVTQGDKLIDEDSKKYTYLNLQVL